MNPTPETQTPRPEAIGAPVIKIIGVGSAGVSLLEAMHGGDFAGAAMVATPPVSNAVASAGTPTFTAVHGAAITLTPTGAGAAGDFQVYAFSAPQSSGTSFCKTFWQAGHVAGNSATAIVATAAYVAQFGAIAAGQRIFVKVTPVNQYGVAGTPYIGFAIVS